MLPTEPLCECGHSREEHDQRLIDARCRHINAEANVPEWAWTKCRCKEFMEAKQGS